MLMYTKNVNILQSGVTHTHMKIKVTNATVSLNY